MSNTHVFSQADYEKEKPADLHTFRMIDAKDGSVVCNSHICIQLMDNRACHVVSDNEGYAKLDMSKLTAGMVVISSIGYVTKYVSIEELGKVNEVLMEPDVFDLDQIVVTGTNTPTRADSSIFKVKVITGKKIEQLGVVTLNELLLAEANIRITSDLILGSQIEMLGMGGSSVKVMIDGVPVIGRIDGNVDLSQINLANVKQVEVVEGPMSVIYGNNALAGTINIITQNNSYYKWLAEANAYAESVGRFVSNANAAFKTGNHSITAEGGYEYFNGVDFDKSDRQMNWKPKNTKRANAGYTFHKNELQVNVNLRLFGDELHNKSNISGTRVYDTYYFTNRYDFSGGLQNTFNKKHHLNMVAAYNYYDRSSQAVNKDLANGEETKGEKLSSQKATQQMMRAIYGTSIYPGVLSMQGGVDVNYETFEGERVIDKSQSIGDYAFFLNLNYKLSDHFELQPGLRYSYNSGYDAPVVYSINTKWHVGDALNWRASFAHGFRAPELKELYYDFVDSNHEIYGNPDLTAESSYNVNTSVDYSIQKNKHHWRFSLSAYYNDVDDMISLVQDENSTQYVYQNITEYQSTGSDISINYGISNFLTMRAGYGITGRYNSYTEQNGSDEFNITNDLFGGFKLTEEKTQTTLSADYKYNGAIPYFYSNSDGNITEGKQDAYHTFNLSVMKCFYQNKLKLTMGAKNLLDVTNVNRPSSGGAHSSGAGIPISYGRSFFINLKYRFTHL
ncbi:TonB-dependent receptor plug domain-containing protein [Carboxylicivirga linearis]|uniref:TonB-dependent receptor n=1 Tax=Carboxylicivirga linearis TaxID=1628157 RepID=A0ABS5JUU1_9BACT|nr:TonB-dependent receptor [Carboxylicivirga linearis]MBS2098680.1 TonB-dependent receptor [Carboxylicivirga linearis]